MVTICIGPVCVPLHLLLPFLVGLMHRRGWFKWFKQEWVTLRFWKSWWAGAPQQKAEAKARPDVKEADTKVQETVQTQSGGSIHPGSKNSSPDNIAGSVRLPERLHPAVGLQQRNIQQQQSHASR